MRMLGTVALTVLLVPSPSPGADSPADPLTSAVGQRVRVSSNGRLSAPHGRSAPDVVGTLQTFDGKHLTVSVKGLDKPVIVPATSIRRLDVSRGKRSLFREGAASGAVIAGLIGLGVAIRCYDQCWDDDEGTGVKGVVGFTLGFGAVGGAFGAIVAAPFRADRWERVPLPNPTRVSRRIGLTVHPVPHGAAANVSLRF